MPAFRKLLGRCLEKNPKNRWHAAADVRIELQSLITQGQPLEESRIVSTPPVWRRAVPVVVGMALAAAVSGAAVWKLRPASPPPPVARFTVTVPENELFNFVNRPMAISRNGMQIVYEANRRLYLRSI